MQTNHLRGILAAVGFVFAIHVGFTSLLRVVPAEWMYAIRPPYDLLAILALIVVITFFAARYIPIDARVFGVIAFTVTFLIMAVDYWIRTPHDQFGVVFVFTITWTIAFLVGFLGHEMRLYISQQERGI